MMNSLSDILPAALDQLFSVQALIVVLAYLLVLKPASLIIQGAEGRGE